MKGSWFFLSGGSKKKKPKILGGFFWTPVNASNFYGPTLAKGPKKNPPKFWVFFFWTPQTKKTNSPSFPVFTLDHGGLSFFWTLVTASNFFVLTLAKGPKKSPPNFGVFFFGPLDKKVTPFGGFFMDHPVLVACLPSPCCRAQSDLAPSRAKMFFGKTDYSRRQ